MANRIHELFCVPPISFARLGGSTAPVNAYTWADPANPRTDGDTVIQPTWTLGVRPDGSVEPFMPTSIGFRDGPLLRPVCPFVEVWARVGAPSANRAAWQEVPLTPDLLAAEQLDPAALIFRFEARNLKAARRAVNPELAFGTIAPVDVASDVHQPRQLNAVSPPTAATPMIPPGRSIPLGSVQVMRPAAQPANGATPWAEEVNVATIRFRFTPARGLFYGPPQAAAVGGRRGPAVTDECAFLDPRAGWYANNDRGSGFVIPGDTFDMRRDDDQDDNPSLGVVDDTCEVRATVTLARPGKPSLLAQANIFSGPPDYAPDRRPFLSVADELNDRAEDWEARNGGVNDDDLDAWVEDLFERIYECVSLFNVDSQRADFAAGLPASMLGPAIPGDGIDRPTDAMGRRDALRNTLLTIAASSANNPLPLSGHARERHLDLADIDALRGLVGGDPDRLMRLVRGPFEAQQLRGNTTEGLRNTTMRMPPFMAQSTPGTPLTLAGWQYDLLMRWTAQVFQPPPAGAPMTPLLAVRAAARQARDAVLDRLGPEGDDA